MSLLQSLISLGGSIVKDLYYNYVTLLLHGDGTNAAQNNTFLDSSTNAFTVTRNGNTTQGAFSPFSVSDGYWSNYFGNGPYLYNGSSLSVSNFGTGNYTFEAWIFRSTTYSGGSHCVYDGRQTAGGTTGFCFTVYQDKAVVIYGPNIIFTGSTTILANQWYHIAVCRGGTGTNQTAVFINGIREGTFTDSNSYGQGYNVIGAVANSPVGAAPFNGYISNLRIVKGTDVYGYTNTSFTVPTTPLTAITNTTLLTCQSNRFKDNSTTAMAFTISGSPSVQVFAPFATSSPYSASVNGGSMYFDGSGDYLSATLTGQAPGTSAFTYECWVYSDLSQTFGIMNTRSGDTSDGFDSSIGTDGSGGCSYTGTPFLTYSAGTIKKNSWTHIAIVFDGNTTWNLYVNGVSVASRTASQNFTSTTFNIGVTALAGNPAKGYISNFRYTKSAVYTGTFTPPTARLTAITNTQLLLSGTNAGIIDNSSVADFETVGNAQVSTTQSKFGGSSMYFDGSGDYLLANASDTNTYAFGSGDFTIEFWIYRNASGVQHDIIAFNPATTNGAYPAIYIGSDNILYYYTQTANRITGTTISTSIWYHVALVKNNSVTKLYINGNQVGSSYADTNSYLCGATRPVIGSAGYTLTGTYNGYIDDLRITNGIARYLYNFTPPTKAYPDSGYATYTPPTTDSYFGQTTLLLHGDGTNGAQNNTFLDSSPNALTITRNGNTTQGTFTPFSRADGYWSNYFAGSGYLSLSSNAAFGMGTGDFTVEAWVFPTSYSGSDYDMIFDFRTAGNQSAFLLAYNSSYNLYAFDGPSNAVWGGTGKLAINQWNHVVLTRNSGTWTIYLNGYSTNIRSSSNDLGSSQPVYIGTAADNPGNTRTMRGYISNFRVVKGSAVYTSNFTPSTTPLTAISGTSLLTCQSNRFKDNSTNAFTITPNGSPSVQPFIPFEPTTAYSTSLVGGSAYFDGSGDYLNTGTSGQFTASGDFTVSCWFYLQSFAASYYAVAGNWSAGTSDEWLIQIANDGSIRFLTSADGTFSSAGVVKLNQWMYFTATRSGTTVTVQVNGTTIRTYTKSDTLGSATKSINIGQQPGNNWPWNGYIADFRLVSGSAITTIPTAPASSSGTSLLLSGTNAGIIDSAATIDFETVTNAQISTSQSKFGGASMYFDGSSYIKAPYSKNFVFEKDFTVEFWLYFTAHGADGGLVAFETSVGAGPLVSWQIRWNSTSNNIKFDCKDGSITSTTTVTTSTWTHVAVTRLNDTATLYINGLNNGTLSSTSTLDSGSYPLYVGVERTVVAYTTGYIDDLRITKGICRYPYNFTIPASAYPNS